MQITPDVQVYFHPALAQKYRHGGCILDPHDVQLLVDLDEGSHAHGLGALSHHAHLRRQHRV